MIVYKIYNDVSDKLYIGITTKSLEQRWKWHLNKCRKGVTTHLYSAMRKYGIEKFHIVQIDSANSLDELKKKEQYYVTLFDTYKSGYNMTEGGDSNPMDCAKSKEKHDATMRDSFTREKISKTMKEKSQQGNLFTEEHRKHLSDAAFKRYNNVDKIKKKSPPKHKSKVKNTTNVINNKEKLSGEINTPTGGKKVIYNLDGKRKYVFEDEIPCLLELGWSLPTNKKKVNKEDWNPNQVHFYQRKKSQDEVHNNLSISHLGHSPSNKGVPRSEDTKKKLADAIRGRKWINNGIIQKQVKPEELEDYLSKGFKLGQLKRGGGDLL